MQRIFIILGYNWLLLVCIVSIEHLHRIVPLTDFGRLIHLSVFYAKKVEHHEMLLFLKSCMRIRFLGLIPYVPMVAAEP